MSGGFLDESDDFIFADDDDVAAAIENDTGADYEIVDEDEVLSDKPSEEPEQEEEPEEDDPEEGDSDEDEDEIEEDSEEEEPRPEKTGDKEADGKADHEYRQRQKRREAEKKVADLERELAYIKGKLDAPQQAQQPEPEEELPELDFADLEGSLDTRYKHLSKRERAAMEKAEHERWMARANASEIEARAEYQDYDDVQSRFLARLNGPDGKHIGELLRAQPDPADWMYHNQKRYEARTQREDPEIAELRAELAALKESQQKLKKKKKPKVAKSMASARGAGARKATKKGPEDASNDIFADLFAKR